jgi:Flp pilus assembly protein TadD
VFFLLDPVLYRARWSRVPVRDWLWAALRLIPFGVMAASYLVARTLILDGARVGTSETTATALRNLGLLWMETLRGYVAPTTTAMRMLHDEWVGLPTGVFVGAWTAAVAILIAAWVGKRLLPSAMVAVVAVYATLLPVAVITADTWPGFGRYLYPAAPFAFIALAEIAIVAAASLRESGRTFATTAIRALGAAWLMAIALLYVATIRTYADMETLAHAMIEESPRSSHGWAALGHERFAAEDYPAAAVALGRAVELSPDKRALWLDLGLARVFSGDNAGALEVASRGANQSDGPGDFYNIAAMALMNSDVPGAARALLGCLAREPGHEACLANVARLTSAHPRAAEYRTAFDQLLALPEFESVAPQLAPLRQGAQR